MKVKKLFLLPLMALVLVGCDIDNIIPEPLPNDPTVPTDSTDPTDSEVTTDPTNPEDPEDPEVPADPALPEFTAEDVKEILEEFAASSVNEYTYWYRYYNGGYYDDAETIDFKIYDDGFDATVTLYSDLPTVSSVSSESYKTGRYASYVLNDDYYIVGVQGLGEDDYYQYNERNMYVTHNNGLNALETLYSDVYNAFLNSTYMWSEYYGFVISDISTSFNDDGNVDVTIGAVAPEGDGYGAETGEVVLEVDPNDYTVISMTLTIVVYSMGQSESTVDEGGTYYGRYRVENISYGDVYTDDIEPFDVSKFTDSQILNAPSQVVENVADGTLSEETIKQILNNYDAYMEGLISSKDESYITEYYHPDYSYVDVGGTTTVTTKYRYDGYILESTTVYTPDDTNYGSYTSSTKYEAKEDGIYVTGDLYNYTISAADVSSMEYYFSASPLTNDLTTTEAFAFIIENWEAELGDKNDGYYQKTSNISGTKSEGKITIEFVYEVSYIFELMGSPYVIYDNTYDYKITIEDNFITSITKDEKTDGTYSHYTMTKGELPAYESA